MKFESVGVLVAADRVDLVSVALERWGDWARGKVGPDRQRCRGLESRYRGEVAQPVAAAVPGGMPDWIGIEVERVVSRLPDWVAALLVAYFVQRKSKAPTARVLRLRFEDYDAHLRRSVLMVDNALKRAGVDIVKKLGVD